MFGLIFEFAKFWQAESASALFSPPGSAEGWFGQQRRNDASFFHRESKIIKLILC